MFSSIEQITYVFCLALFSMVTKKQKKDGRSVLVGKDLYKKPVFTSSYIFKVGLVATLLAAFFSTSLNFEQGPEVVKYVLMIFSFLFVFFIVLKDHFLFYSVKPSLLAVFLTFLFNTLITDSFSRGVDKHSPLQPLLFIFWYFSLVFAHHISLSMSRKNIFSSFFKGLIFNVIFSLVAMVASVAIFVPMLGINVSGSSGQKIMAFLFMGTYLFGYIVAFSQFFTDSLNPKSTEEPKQSLENIDKKLFSLSEKMHSTIKRKDLCDVCDTNVASDVCERCGNEICPFCGETIDNRRYCTNCVDSVKREHKLAGYPVEITEKTKCGMCNDKLPIQQCRSCDKPLCADCTEILGDKPYCDGCYAVQTKHRKEIAVSKKKEDIADDNGIVVMRGYDRAGKYLKVGVKVMNNSEYVITGVKVTLDVPDGLVFVEPANGFVQLGTIEPDAFLSANFKLKPQGKCVDGVFSGLVIYRDYKNQRQSALVKEMRITSICPMLEKDNINAEDFHQLMHSGRLKRNKSHITFKGNTEDAFSMAVGRVRGLYKIEEDTKRKHNVSTCYYCAYGKTKYKHHTFVVEIFATGTDTKGSLTISVYSNESAILTGFFAEISEDIEHAIEILDERHSTEALNCPGCGAPLCKPEDDYCSCDYCKTLCHVSEWDR